MADGLRGLDAVVMKALKEKALKEQRKLTEKEVWDTYAHFEKGDIRRYMIGKKEMSDGCPDLDEAIAKELEMQEQLFAIKVANNKLDKALTNLETKTVEDRIKSLEYSCQQLWAKNTYQTNLNSSLQDRLAKAERNKIVYDLRTKTVATYKLALMALSAALTFIGVAFLLLPDSLRYLAYPLFGIATLCLFDCNNLANTIADSLYELDNKEDNHE